MVRLHPCNEEVPLILELSEQGKWAHDRAAELHWKNSTLVVQTFFATHSPFRCLVLNLYVIVVVAIFLLLPSHLIS
jgi:hypothetical protein